MILTEDELDSLLHVQHRSPHELLGMHQLSDGSGVVVRAFLPGATNIEVVRLFEQDWLNSQMELWRITGIDESPARLV